MIISFLEIMSKNDAKSIKILPLGLVQLLNMRIIAPEMILGL